MSYWSAKWTWSELTNTHLIKSQTTNSVGGHVIGSKHANVCEMNGQRWSTDWLVVTMMRRSKSIVSVSRRISQKISSESHKGSTWRVRAVKYPAESIITVTGECRLSIIIRWQCLHQKTDPVAMKKSSTPELDPVSSTWRETGLVIQKQDQIILVFIKCYLSECATSVNVSGRSMCQCSLLMRNNQLNSLRWELIGLWDKQGTGQVIHHNY